MTVSLVYSSISPWMRRKRGILPLYSCFLMVEYTSCPGIWKGPGVSPLATCQAFTPSHSPSPPTHTIKQNQGVLIRAEGGEASPLPKQSHRVIDLVEIRRSESHIPTATASQEGTPHATHQA